MAWQKTRITLPPGLKPAQREAIAQDVLEFIQDRAIGSNTGFNPDTGRNKKFPKYSKEYAASKGSSRGDVDLILSGDMFSAMKLLNHTASSLLIGFDNGSDENAKAEGNQTGSYGKAPDSSKARPFLGLTNADLNRIIARHDN